MKKTQKQHRVIFHLSNGRAIYTTRRGEVDLWSDAAIDEHLDNFQPYRMAYTPEGWYGSADTLRELGLTQGKDLLYVIGFSLEDPTAPIEPDRLPTSVFNGGNK